MSQKLIEEYDKKYSAAQLKKMLEEKFLSTSGNKTNLITRLLSEPEGDKYSVMKVSELKEELKKLGLPYLGTKEVLINTLREHDDSISLPKEEDRADEMLPHARLVRKRDKKYYKQVKPIVTNMPNLLKEQFQSKEAKISGEWTNDDKWKALLFELETLDDAVNRGDSGQIELDFINMIMSYDEREKQNKVGKKMTNIKRFFDNNPQIVKEWFETYPHLAYVTMMQESFEGKRMRYYAIAASKPPGINFVKYISQSMLKFLDHYEIASHIEDEETAKYLDEKLNLFNGVLVGTRSIVGNASLPLLKYILSKNEKTNVSSVDIGNSLHNFEKLKLVLSVYDGEIYWFDFEDLWTQGKLDSIIYILENYKHLITASAIESLRSRIRRGYDDSNPKILLIRKMLNM